MGWTEQVTNVMKYPQGYCVSWNFRLRTTAPTFARVSAKKTPGGYLKNTKGKGPGACPVLFYLYNGEITKHTCVGHMYLTHMSGTCVRYICIENM